LIATVTGTLSAPATVMTNGTFVAGAIPFGTVTFT
jgi:hypothetical protein